MVICSRPLFKVTRAFGSSNSRMCEFPGSQSNNSLCLIDMPSSEVIGTADGDCSWTPSGGGLPPNSGVRHNCGDLTLPPADHTRSTLSCLAHIGHGVPAAPGCWFLGRDSDQTSGCCPECLAVAAAGQMISQGAESNNVWCWVAVPSFLC